MVRNKLYICKEYHIQPSEIDVLPFYEYEYILEDIETMQKEQEKEQENQKEMFNDMQSNYKMPSMNNFNMPKIEIPKF